MLPYGKRTLGKNKLRSVVQHIKICRTDLSGQRKLKSGIRLLCGKQVLPCLSGKAAIAPPDIQLPCRLHGSAPQRTCA